MAQPPPHASYSSIDSWLQCGLKYKLTRIDRHPEEPAWWSIGGSAVHLATERYDLGLGAHAGPLFHEALDLEIAEARKFNPDSPADIWRASRGQTEEWWRDNGPGMVQNWIDWRHATGWHLWTDDEHNLTGVEVPVMADIGGLPVKGYIDRIFVTEAGEVVIVDLKSGARKPESGLQLGFYRAALIVQYGLTADLGGYWMARKKAGEQLDVQGLDRYTPQFVAEFVAGFKRAREADLYLPHVTSFCRSCGVAAHCWAVN